MRNPTSLALICFLALSSFAQTPAKAPREVFPSDYKPSPCALGQTCKTFARSDMRSMASTLLGLQLDMNWVDRHGDEADALFAPICRKHATCLTEPQNNYLFCDDVISEDLRASCEKRFPKSGNYHDWEQCETYMEVFELGAEINMKKVWQATLEGCKDQPVIEHTKPLDVWVVPAEIPRENKDYVSFHAIDPDTHVPIMAKITIEDQIVWVPTNPAGILSSYYPVKLPIKYKRVPNAEGHTDLMPREVTVEAEHYPTLRFPLPTRVPRLVVSMSPDPSTLHRGSNQINVTTRDADTGKPVEMQVWFGTDLAGESNQPLTLELKTRTHPEIWVKSPFDLYSDMVVAK